MPGNNFPSKYSNEAPPPVEIWVILSATPAFSTAAAESPPPITVTAFIFANLLAIEFVPKANYSNSESPAGPFHNTVAAFSNSFE